MTDARLFVISTLGAAAAGEPLLFALVATVGGGLLTWSLLRNVADLDRRLRTLEQSDRAHATAIAALQARRE